MPRALSFSLLGVFLSILTHAVGASQILGLDINGTVYDVTFHDDPASFNSLWDSNGDGTLGDGSLGKTPEFWGNGPGAAAAADAIIARLADTGVTLYGGDGFLIPYATQASGIVWVATDQNISLGTDVRIGGTIDEIGALTDIGSYASEASLPWASFAPASVPLPFTPALLLIGALAAGATRRIRRAN